MASKIFVDQVDPESGTTLTLGTSGDTFSIPSGVTITNSGTDGGGFGAGKLLSFNSGNLQTTSYTSTSETYAASGFKAQITPTATGSSFIVKIPFMHVIVTTDRWSYCQPWWSTDDSSYAEVVSTWFANPKSGTANASGTTFQGMPSFFHATPTYSLTDTLYWQVYIYHSGTGSSQVQAMGNTGWKWWAMELGA